MKNWRTTLFGLLAFVSLNSELLGLPEKAGRIASGLIIALGFSQTKDRNVTGGTVYQGSTTSVLVQKDMEKENVLAGGLAVQDKQL